MTSRAALAAPLLLQTPPGQLPNVYEDLVGLVKSEGDDPQADEDEFQKLAIRVRADHNLEQHIVVDLPGGKGKSILSPAAVHPSEPGRFFAPREGCSFVVDHETLVTSDAKPYKPNQKVESLRSLLEKFLSVYVEDRFDAGLVGVFARPLPRAAKEEKTEGGQAQDEGEASQEGHMRKPAGDEAEGGVEDAMEGQTSDGNKDQAAESVGDDEIMHEGQGDVEEGEPGLGGAEQGEKSDNTEIPQMSADAIEPETKVQDAPKEDEDEETQGETALVMHIVANRYKLSNFWSGRWRSTYTLASPTATDLEGQINVQIHYFEEGNVQLNSSKTEQLTVSGQGSEEATAKAVVRAIEAFEASYQDEIFKDCNELSEGAFRSLRRQLPMTKQKVDWDKVLNYKLGAELTE